MRVVLAATLEQRKVIEDLKNHLYHSVFPLYFNHEEIGELQSSKVLETPEREDWLETVEDACRVIASLQVMISLLKVKRLPLEDFCYKNIFNKNKRILQQFQISFPFTYSQFAERHQADLAFSMFARVANEFMI